MSTAEFDAERWLHSADRASDWSAIRAVVVGMGTSGLATAKALLRVGARVSVVDASDSAALRERADQLESLGAKVRLGADLSSTVDADLLVPSPGFRPTHPWFAQSGIRTVWSSEQLAWQLRPLHRPAPWLVISGTNGKTTTVEMLAQILRAEGHRAAAVGNVGTPVVEAVFDEPSHDVLAVELSSFQLHYTHGLRPHSSALLNVGADHLDWHGSMASYVAAKSKVYLNTEKTAVYNVQDRQTYLLSQQALLESSGRTVGFTLTEPGPDMVGLVDGMIVDRAFSEQQDADGLEIVRVSSLATAGAHNVANALAASAMARSFDVSGGAIAEALQGFTAGGHRLQHVARVAGVDYVDDSKATNVHAADVALSNYRNVVWIAGGLAKGGRFDTLVREHRHRMRGAVLLGADRGLIEESMKRHAAEIPLIDVPDGETDPMGFAVLAARRLAHTGDVVLLAPACASMDLYVDYNERGRAFQDAVHRLPE